MTDSVQNITINRFDPKKMKPNCINVFIGKRNTGKTFLIKDILFHHRHRFPVAQVISKTEHLSKFFEKFVPKMLIYKDYASSIIEKLFKRQALALEQQWEKPDVALVFDDCLSDKSWQKDPLVRSIFMEGRHSKIDFFLGIQAPNEIPPAFRGQIDYIFILRNNNLADRDRLHQNYAGMMEKEVFKKLMDVFTEDYGVLVIDCLTKSNKLIDQVFYYKALDHPDFKLCSKKLWMESEQNYRNVISDKDSVKYTTRKGVYNIRRGE